MCDRQSESAVHMESHPGGAQNKLALPLVPGGVCSGLCVCVRALRVRSFPDWSFTVSAMQD